MRNLVRMSRGGIRVPEVVLLRNQVLLMSFIGRDGRPVPKLKEAAERMSAYSVGSSSRNLFQPTLNRGDSPGP